MVALYQRQNSTLVKHNTIVAVIQVWAREGLSFMTLLIQN